MARLGRAGVSVSLWRQVEAGYMTPTKGMHTPKIAPAPTVARMAKAVNLSVEDLESEGQRPDAAEILREIIRQHNTDGITSGDQQTALASSTSLELGPGDILPDMSPEIRAATEAHLPGLQGIFRLAAISGPDTPGSAFFPGSPHEAHRWDRLVAAGYIEKPGRGYSPQEMVWMIAIGRALDDARRDAERRAISDGEVAS
jgi:hypothetical protein